MNPAGNQLAGAASPYLRQHAENPVHWQEWSPAALAEAAKRDVPILLSVGYAACHWCHVMAHESFDDDEVAAAMNGDFVCIKVDREERPDIDAVYMNATVALTGQGGWPMTCFLTPDGRPFYCGTYYPKDAFLQLLSAVSSTWNDRRDEVEQSSDHIAGELRSMVSGLPGGGPQVDPALCDHAVAAVLRDEDTTHGGFGGAPKFPPSALLEALLRHWERTGSPRALAAVHRTGTAMARGGMYDQLGGGFARYSVDEAWVVPHFEKMLYDNALLARVYAHLWRRTGSELARRVAAETCDWMVRELRTPQGGLSASLDADSEGEEGKFYVWSPAELDAVLGPEEGGYAGDVFSVSQVATFEHGRSVLQRRAEALDPDRFAAVRAALFTAREERPRPGRDDKVVAAWNGLAIAALAETGLLLDRGDLIEAATASAELLARVHLSGGQLARSSRDGIAGSGAGVLDDYACVADGFLALSGVTGEARWVALAGELLDTVLESFGDGNGGFFDTAAGAERLIYRPADPADNATPSGTFAAAGALLSYGALTGSARHRDAALAALAVLPALAGRFPRAAGWGLAVAEGVLAGPAEIAVVGPPGDERTHDLLRTALEAAPPGAVLALGDGAGPDGTGPDGTGTGPEGTGPDTAPVPLLTGRGLVNGAAAAYVCRNFACQLPVTDPTELRAALSPAR